MSMTDPIADMLVRIKNALAVGKPQVSMPASKMKLAIANVLKSEGYIGEFRVVGEGAKAKLEIIRNGKRQNLDVSVGALPDDDADIGTGTGADGSAERSSNRLGVAVSDLTAEQKQVIFDRLSRAREDALLTGELEPTNEAYALAKIAGIVQTRSYRRQYGASYISAMPTNLYGPGDHFHPSVSHVIPALIKKCVEAKENGDLSVSVWGTGTASRDYLYVADAAQAIVLAAEVRNNQVTARVRFSQADSSDSRIHGGSGLGLAVSKSIIGHMHGSIGYMPNTPQGSCFYIELPFDASIQPGQLP